MVQAVPPSEMGAEKGEAWHGEGQMVMVVGPCVGEDEQDDQWHSMWHHRMSNQVEMVVGFFKSLKCQLQLEEDSLPWRSWETGLF